TPYWLGVWHPPLAVTFHFLSPSSKLTHKSPRVTVSVPRRTAMVIDISGLLYETKLGNLLSRDSSRADWACPYIASDGLQPLKLHVAPVEAPLIVLLEHHGSHESHDGRIVGE